MDCSASRDFIRGHRAARISHQRRPAGGQPLTEATIEIDDLLNCSLSALSPSGAI
jgi:hypothetical protein